MPASKPSIGQLLIASGYTNFESSVVTRAINALYGNVGANLDERNWDAILSSADPLGAAEAALRAQWQNPSYLLRNAQYILSIGYFDISAEVTYRQMGQRLGYVYDNAWSKGTSFESISAMSDATLNALAQAYSAAYATPTINFNTTATGASFSFSHAGRLTWSVSGAATDVTAGTLALTPAGLGGVVREGVVTLTRDSGAAATSSTYVVVGTDTAMPNRDFGADQPPIRNRLIVLGAGDDTISAGDGDDTVYGGAGNDRLFGNQGDDLIYGGDGNDTIQAGQGNDTVYGGAGNDLIYGGSSGIERLNGGAGSDRFLFQTDSTGITVEDFSLADNDVISFRDGIIPATGRVDFAAVTSPGAPNAALLAADFDAVASVAAVRSDTGGAGAGNNQVYVITGTQTTAQIQAAVPSGALNAYVVVYDSTQGRAKIYFDSDWSDATSRVEVATLLGLSAADVAALGLANFAAWNLI